MLKFDNSKNEFLFLAGIVAIILIWTLYSNHKFSSQGVYTICRVDHYEPGGSGSDLYIDIYYQGIKYKAVANALCNGCDGKLYFVQIVKNKPTGTVRFLGDYPVPDCISIDDLPKEGWTKIPQCQ